MSSANANAPGLEAFGGPADLDKYITVLYILLTRAQLQSADECILACMIYDQIVKLYLRKWHLTEDQNDQNMAKRAVCNRENHAKVMINLASDLSDRFESRKPEDENTESIDSAVRMGHETIRILGKDPVALNVFSTIVLTRFEALGNPADLKLATNLVKQALEAANPQGLSGAIYGVNYANCLRLQYEGSHDMEDLAKAIELLMAAKEAASTNPGLPTVKILANLTQVLNLRYEALGAGPDLFDAIHYSLTALELSKKERDGSYPVILNNLAAFLHSYYQAEPTEENLINAMSIARDAVKALEDNPSRQAHCLYNLASMLEDEARLPRDDASTEDQIDALNEGISLMDAPGQIGHAEKALVAKSLNLSSRLLKLRYELAGCTDAVDVEKAITKSKAAVKMCNERPDQKGDCLVQLGDVLQLKYDKDKTDDYFEAAMSAFRECAQMHDAGTLIRICALHRAVLLYIEREEWGNAATCAEKAVNMLPHLALSAPPGDDQQRALNGLSGLSGLAASLALKAGWTAGKSFKLLEAGRGITSMRINNFSQTFNLDQDGQALLESYKRLRRRLETPLASGWLEVGYSAPLTDEISARAKDAESAKQLEEKLLAEYGVDLDLRLSEEEIVEAALQAPIVAFVVNDIQSAALIATKDGIDQVLLPGVDVASCIKKYITMQLPIKGALRVLDFESAYEINEDVKNVLAWLWDMAIKPVLQHLGFYSVGQLRNVSSPQLPEGLPRIHWITSGVLGMMPIHAAGHHHASSTENTLSHVVSSYTTTVFSLRQSIRNAKFGPFGRWNRPSSLPKAVIIAMPTTPGDKWPDFDPETVPNHLAAIEQFVPEEHNRIYLEHPSSSAALELLDKTHIVHFVCHAVSQKNPPNSSFALCRPVERGADRDTDDHDALSPSGLILDPLTVRQLAHRTSSAQSSHALAFLAACQTADIGLEKGLVEETIHLAGALQLLNFTNVVGTLWEVNEVAAADFARMFYAALARRVGTGASESEEEADTNAVARAAHDAMLELRANDPDDAVTWAPLACFGA